ncbi:MAG: transcription termination factor NusA [Candidatus Buchananbacteria bacterium]
MSQSPIQQAIKQICEEKNLSESTVIATIEAALAAAYRKDFGEKNQNVKVKFDLVSAGSEVFDVKTVVEDLPPEELAELAREEAEKKEEKLTVGVKYRNTDYTELTEGEIEKKKFNPRTELQISDAKKIKKSAEIGEEIWTKLEVPAAYGRMAAQTAKQVIIQKIREAERLSVFEEYKTKEGQVIHGVVQRREPRVVLIDLEHATAIMPLEEQTMRERYSTGNRIKIYVLSVENTPKGPQIIVSRAHPEIVKKLFAMEIPEIASNIIEIKGIAREAGSRSKVAVYTEQKNIDPIGSCVGQRGSRIQTIIAELGGEKIDIILWDAEAEKYITNALSPAKVLAIELNEEAKTATVQVKDDQLSLAIGRDGQNVRLASRLTGYKIDIISTSGVKPEDLEVPVSELAVAKGQEVAEEAELVKAEEPTEKKEKAVKGGKKKKTKATEEKVTE